MTLISRPRPIEADCRTVSFLLDGSVEAVVSLGGSGLSLETLDFSVTLFLAPDASELEGGGGAPSWSIGSSSSISSSSEAEAAGALASPAVALRAAMGFTEKKTIEINFLRNNYVQYHREINKVGISILISLSLLVSSNQH